VCLLIAVSGVVADAPLIVAANRDERYDRPATAITVLREAGPRLLGGRDELAGGTWLAVSETGLVAGLTNLPSPQGRDPAKRSRGELPIALAAHPTAAAAVAWARASIRPDDYNPCWMLVGDRSDLYYIDITSGSRPVARHLPAGAYVLENEPLGAGSAKARHVARLAGQALAGQPRAGDGRVAAGLVTGPGCRRSLTRAASSRPAARPASGAAHQRG